MIWPSFCLVTLPTKSRVRVDPDYNLKVSPPGGGFIHSWTHLYKSESPSQVAIFIIAFFCMVLKDVPENIRSSKKYFLAYDNVCNLSNMKLWREPLPIKSFANLWTENLIKIIDSIHLHNHKRESCHKDFNPKILKEKLPDGNTVICEQTFCWLGRFKRILNALPKHRFEFMLHRLIIHQNRYTEYCHLTKKYPHLPSMKKY